MSCRSSNTFIGPGRQYCIPVSKMWGRHLCLHWGKLKKIECRRRSFWMDRIQKIWWWKRGSSLLETRCIQTVWSSVYSWRNRKKYEPGEPCFSRAIGGILVELLEVIDLEEAEFLQYCFKFDEPYSIRSGYLDFELQPKEDDAWFTEYTDDGKCIYASESLDWSLLHASMEDVFRMLRDLLDWK